MCDVRRTCGHDRSDRQYFHKVVSGANSISSDARSCRQPTASITMNCHYLAERITGLRPELSPIDVARLTLMILAQCDDERVFSDDKGLSAALHNASFRLEAASDQHAAVAN